MIFSEAEKTAIVSLWEKASGNVKALGAEVLERLFLSFPQTKISFGHIDMSPESQDLQVHGGKLLGAFGEATKYLDNLDAALPKLSILNAYHLKTDPGNFMLLSYTIQVTLAANFQAEFDATAQAAWNKFLEAISTLLTSKHR
ncbi:MGC82602 protein [Xenopus laevis]|uniref:MGC82602 protein n=1 Tax=Xenopus laevis TaxID=8355 RepID=Q6GPU5_XENLA|nr:Hemoglobin subunit alpha-3 [Xenopus laevis]AAH73013.1 MGC82602 protein [Xenopus laevis]